MEGDGAVRLLSEHGEELPAHAPAPYPPLPAPREKMSGQKIKEMNTWDFLHTDLTSPPPLFNTFVMFLSNEEQNLYQNVNINPWSHLRPLGLFSWHIKDRRAEPGARVWKENTVLQSGTVCIPVISRVILTLACVGNGQVLLLLCVWCTHACVWCTHACVCLCVSLWEQNLNTLVFPDCAKMRFFFCILWS